MKKMIIPRYRVEIGLKEILNVHRGLKYFNSLNKDDVLFFNAGSEAIAFYLIELKKIFRKKLTVGVPLYACWSIFDSVFSSLNDIKFLDIGFKKDSYIIDQSQFSDIDVLIIIHYYGIQCGQIKQIKQCFPNLVIIEDCSHVSMKHNLNFKTSNVSIYSFNLHKPIAAGGGGALIFNDEINQNMIRHNYTSLPNIKDVNLFKIFIKLLLRNFGFHPFIYSIIYKRLISKRAMIKRRTEKLVSYKINTISKYILGNQYFKSVTKYKKQYLKIPGNFRINVSDEQVENMSYFPLIFKDALQASIAKNLFIGLGIDCFVLWENTVKYSYYYGNYAGARFKETEKILSTILFLPEPLFSEKKHSGKLSHVVEILNKYNDGLN